MDPRTVLPVLAQYTGILIPIAITLIIAVVGMQVATLAGTYNRLVHDVRIRGIVSSVVKEAELTLDGGPVKKAAAVSKLVDLVPGLRQQDAARLVEAAVLDLKQFEALAPTVLPASALIPGSPVGPALLAGPLAMPQTIRLEHIVLPPPALPGTPTGPSSTQAAPAQVTPQAPPPAQQDTAPVAPGEPPAPTV